MTPPNDPAEWRPEPTTPMNHIGRILALSDRAEPDRPVAAVWSCGEVVELTAAELAPLRDLVPGDIVSWGEADAQHLARPTHPARFPQMDGDFQRFSERGGMRWRAVHDRAAMLRTVRAFFDDGGFVEIDPPAIAFSPGLEVHLDAVGVQVRQGMGGAVVSRWLTTSPEYHHKRLLSAGFEQTWSMGKVFRSGERGRHHNPEFTMLEWYRAGQRYPAIVRDGRALIEAVFSTLQPCMDAERRRALAPVFEALRRPTWVLSFAEALTEIGGLRTLPDDPEGLIAAFVEHVDPRLPTDRLLVIDRWPAALASLARRFDDRPELAERFEIYLCGVELANGFSELVDPVEQRARFEVDLQERGRLGLPQYPVDEAFLAALSEGCPPAAGVALGVDRLLMVLGGYQDIGDVMPFPFERA